ncbi:erythropoietin receptor isoform X2 [Engystomops pustulosus]|uniref:erythropoietin receptor isoform X2 n=1 Tax=Engystomops pustulosus TaxID=76066 RepID=UPI003AFA66CA
MRVWNYNSQHRLYRVIQDKSEIPLCFTPTLYDFVCFWESHRSDASSYTFYYKPEVNACSLTTVEATNDTWWHLCQIPSAYVDLFSLDPFHITLIDHEERRNYTRTCSTEHFVYLEPLKIIQVQEHPTPPELWVIVNDTYSSLLTFTYQVKYTSQENNLNKTGTVQEVEARDGYRKLILRNYVRGAKYTLSVRVKAAGTYDGYWSDWTDVDVQISDAVDIFHVLLYVFAGLILIGVIILVITCQKRFLKKKVWPKIPSPEHHFKELYTTHKGNFKLWLDQTDAYLMWISRNMFHEVPISTLEVLSELPNAMPPPLPSAPLPPKDSYVTLDKTFLPQFPSWMITQRQIDAQMELLGPSEASSQEKTSRSVGRPEEDASEMPSDEVPPVEESKGCPTKEKPGSLTIQREDSLSSEEGKLSPGSSFEYTVLETCDGLLFPRARSVPPRQPLKYAYLLMSEPGEDSPPPSPNIYQNSICTQLPAHVYSQ